MGVATGTHLCGPMEEYALSMVGQGTTATIVVEQCYYDTH